MSEIARTKLSAAVSCALLDGKDSKLDSIRLRIFGENLSLDPSTEATLRAAHSAQFRIAFLAKEKGKIANGIAEYDEDGAQDLAEELSAITPDAKQLARDVWSFQQKVNRRKQTISGEFAFQEALADWLRSGEQTKEMWLALKKFYDIPWERRDRYLCSFRDKLLPLLLQTQPARKSSSHEKLLEAMERMNEEDDFVDDDKIHSIVGHCFSQKMTRHDGHLRVECAIIPASLLKKILCDARSGDADDVIHTVSIYAADCCTLDESLDQATWAGVNLCIVTRRLVVHEGVSIDLSGVSYGQRPLGDRYADRSTRFYRPGDDGKQGRPGGSSGNLCILAAEIVGAEKLTVRLNGGTGEDGQHGGDGCRGDDGEGVTESEITDMDYPHDTRSSREKRCIRYENNVFSKIYQFIDDRGREVYHSRHGPTQTTLTFVQGTLGQAGGRGGAGGTGGEGGYAGTCQISDHTGTKQWSLGSVERKRGETGSNGYHGSCGARGDDGNDMRRFDGTDGISFLSGKLRMTFVEQYTRPKYSLLVPHLNSITTVLFTNKTWSVWETYTPEHAPVEAPSMRYSERAQARAQNTLQSSTAMEEFAQVEGLSLSDDAELFHQSTTAVGAEANTINTEERVQMVRERLPGIEDYDWSGNGILEKEVEQQQDRPSLLGCTQGLSWESISELMRAQFHDSDFRAAQEEVIAQNAELLERLQQFINDQPSVATCLEKITAVFGQNAIFLSSIDLTRNALVNNGGSFIRLLSGLITADGDEPCTLKWQTIIDLIERLASTSTFTDWTFLSLVLAATPLDKVLDELIIIRCSSVVPLPMSDFCEISRDVRSTVAKALLMLKLEKLEMENAHLHGNDFVKVVTLLRHAGQQQLQQLSTLSLQEWVAIADRQQWKVVDQEQFDNNAYYLGVLGQAGFSVAETRMREALREWKHDGKLFGVFVHCIVSNEIDAGECFYNELLRNGRLEGQAAYEELVGLIPTAEHRLDDLPPLVRGLQDFDERAKQERLSRNLRIGRAICECESGDNKSADGDVSKNARLLARFDDALEATCGKRLRAVQKMSVMCALESGGNLLQQVSTGQGKSFIIAAIAAIYCLRDKRATVDVITSSSVLAERDATQLSALYKRLGLTVAHNGKEAREDREIAYKARIVYGDMAHFQRDYLLHTFYRKNIRGSRQLNHAIVDEVDNMTLDSGNHVLYLSHKIASLKLLDSLFAFIQREVYSSLDGETHCVEEIRDRALRDICGRLSKEDLQLIDAKHADTVYGKLVEAEAIDTDGYLLIRKVGNLSALKTKLKNVVADGTLSILMDALRLELQRSTEILLPFHLRDFVRMHLSNFIENCKRARVMRPNVDYVVDRDSGGSNELIVTIIDADTGTDLESTQWAGGLHQFLQMKHACRITPMSLKAVFISNVTFLRKYNHLNGLSGTLGSAEESRILADLYNVDLIRIPTHSPRIMQEFIPSLSASEAQWIDGVYSDVAREVANQRSVLVICETIDQLLQLHRGLTTRNASERGKHEKMDAALDSITVYRRQHQQLEYEERGLEQGRLILSTNLAGRGTDILLSDELERNGGLHVIIGFVPRNRRIEEQAFGRAARAGAPGSGRIVARLGDPSDNLHNFKARRDNAEVLRIQSLRHHFDFRTAVEEGALERFRAHIDSKLFREEESYERLPDAEDVIYRALLDEWTLFLDGKDEEITQCADGRDVRQKEYIISSVDSFLSSHRVEMDGTTFILPRWIRAGEWLLRLAIIQMCHEKGGEDARNLLDRIAEDGDALAPYATYYRACMLMRNFAEMRDEQSTTVTMRFSSDLSADVAEAIRLFSMARSGMVSLLERRNAEVGGVLQRADDGAATADCGLQAQLEELTSAVHQITSNIDWLIGQPLESPAAFRPLTEITMKQRQLFEALQTIDVIAPPILGDKINERITACHTIVRRKFGIGRVELLRALEDGDKPEEGVPHRTVMLGGGLSMMQRKVALPTRFDFWQDMHALDAFYNIDHVYFSKEVIPSASPLLVDEKLAHNSVLYSNRCLRDIILYTKADIDALASSDSTVRDLLDSGALELDLLATIDAERLSGARLLQFDGFSPVQFKEHLDLNESTANWLLCTLCSHGVIELQQIHVVKLSDNWRMKIDSFEWSSSFVDFKLNKEHLSGLEQLESAFTISAEVLQYVVDVLKKLPVGDADRAAGELFETLLENGTIHNREVLIYRQAGSIDCSMLPPALADHVHRFLTHHFAYSFARDVLATACYDSIHAPYTIKEVMLPLDPHQELFDELCKLEVISPPRIISRHFELIDYNDYPFVEKRDLENFIHTRRLKLRDDIQPFALVPFTEYLKERGVATSSEMNALIDVGMAAGISLKKLSTAKKIVGAVVEAGRWLVSKGMWILKGVTGVIGMVLGAVVHTASEWIGAGFNKLAAYAPTEFNIAAYTFASAVVDGVGWVEKKIAQGVAWTGERIMEGLAWGAEVLGDCVSWLDENVGTNLAGIAEAAGNTVSRCLTYMQEQCRALFGSAEYYNQCRMATNTIAARAPLARRMDEYRIVRTFNNVAAASEEQSAKVDAREQELIDEISAVARYLSAEFLSKIDCSSAKYYSGLTDYLSTLEHKRWFESELELSIQFAAMEAQRVLTKTGRVDGLKGGEIKRAALLVAYAAMSDAVEEECEEVGEDEEEEDDEEEGEDEEDGYDEEDDEDEGECLRDVVADIINQKISELFTNPLEHFVRCILTEISESTVSEPHHALKETDIAKAAQLLRTGNSNVWLDPLHRERLIWKIHARIASQLQQLEMNKDQESARSIIDLIRMCLAHRLPMPVKPCLSVLTRASNKVEKCFEQEQSVSGSDKRFVFLSKADYSLSTTINPNECIYLFTELSERDQSIGNEETFRNTLIHSLTMTYDNASENSIIELFS